MRPAARFASTAVAVALASATLSNTPANAEISASSTDTSVVVTTQVAANKKARVLRFRAAVKKLPMRNEKRSGYQRSKFRHWVDVDRDCQNTRAEVLKTESRTRTTGGCTIRTGKWRSVYDAKVVRTASKLDIDHMVPLAEAWDSGARGWSAATRKAYANDLGDKRSLVAVTARTNRSKSDRDPAQWFPTKSKCAYARNWTAVKLRWGLSVNRFEKRKLIKVSRMCPNAKIRYTKARVTKKSSGGGGGGGGTDPDYGTCAAAKAAGADVPYYRGPDPEYYFYRDSDSDGVVCE